MAMSQVESSVKKTAAPPQADGGENGQENHKAGSDRHISSTLAHELNNLLTVVQGHAERLFVKHREDSALASNLKTISDATRRAAELVRSAPRFDDYSPPA
jgi:signal transduction histidine kinase